MQQDLIAAEEFCRHYNIEYSFINSLQQHGLIEVTTIRETGYLPSAQLPVIEKLIRLHTDLDINLEGIEAINYLLQRIEEMQHEITLLKNKLRAYE
jgi:hypothetical protein